MIHWQTGEPPRGTELLIEYRLPPRTDVLCDVFTRSTPAGAYWCGTVTSIEAAKIEVIRWSTLDAAPDVLGRLEALLLMNPSPCVEADRYEGLWHVRAFDERLGLIGTGSAQTLAAAIEQLCGGTDDSK